MKRMIVGIMLGATITAVATCGSTKCLKKAKKVITSKLEKIIG